MVKVQVLQDKEKITSPQICVCTLVKVLRNCDEGFLRGPGNYIDKLALIVNQNKCSQAVSTNGTPFEKFID